MSFVTNTSAAARPYAVDAASTVSVPSGKSVLELDASAAATVNLLSAYARQGREVTLFGGGTSLITLAHVDKARASESEMSLSAGADMVLNGGDSITLRQERAGNWVEVRRGRNDGDGFYTIELRAVLEAVSTDMDADVPAGAVIDSVQLRVITALTGGSTTVKVGVGPVADPDKYGITSDLTIDEEFNTYPAFAQLSSAEDVKVNACATGGGIGDTALSGGEVVVRVRYKALTTLHS